MISITFGQLLEKLVYFSKQKKTTLAKELGYDVSYISKWISNKNLPTQKNIANICEVTSKFIVDSLTQSSMNELKNYFEVDKEMSTDELYQYIENILKESYMATAQKSIPNIHKHTHLQENYNNLMHINPRLRKQYLTHDIEVFMSRSNKIDLLLSANFFKLNYEDKLSIADIKPDLIKLKDNISIKVRLLIGFEGDNDDIIFNTILLINMISLYPTLDFQIYNCEVDSNTIISIIKDNLLHTATFTKHKRCLFTTLSKEKSAIDEMYYTLDGMIKNHGNPLVETISSVDTIKKGKYIQYIMGQDLRWLIGSMNELLMPPDLFKEIAESIFDDKEILEELNKINLFLQSITYKSKLKVLIYEAELERYIATGALCFFNIPIKLSFDQISAHINYIKSLIKESDLVEIKLIDGNFVQSFKDYKDPSLYLSKNMKFLKIDNEDNISDYAIIKDNKFKNICDEFYTTIWQNENHTLINDKEEILDKLEKNLAYASIINSNQLEKFK